MGKTKKYTREELVALCEKATVPESKWDNRDSQEAQSQIGKAWALLRSGCRFRQIFKDDNLKPDDQTIWIDIYSRGFRAFEGGQTEEETFYIPTEKSVTESDGDWYT